MDFNIDLDKLLEEVKNKPKELKDLAQKVSDQHKKRKPESKEEIDQWASDLAENLSQLND